MKYTVFFNRDCCKYGVQDENGCQVLIQKTDKQPREKCFCYAKYKGVAQKYCDKLNSKQYKVFTY